jgi:PncC family amidohydrolase
MDTDALAQAVGLLLRQRHLTLAVAESCTGGLLATHLTNIPGSSAYFEGAIVAYSYEAKKHVLGVPASVLERYGAVSSETVTAMAEGVRQLLQTDVALAITGIAGPTGATPVKPVGLVYVALASEQGVDSRRYLWTGDRWENREWSARAALELLQAHLTSSNRDIVPYPPNGSRDLAPTGHGRDEDDPGALVVVEARFDSQGRLTPLVFKWQGAWMQVASVGRTWSAEDAGRVIQHYMVSTPHEAVFELAFDLDTMRWRVVRGSTRQMTA